MRPWSATLAGIVVIGDAAMSLTLYLLIYAGIALSLGWLRRRQGTPALDAWLVGLLWPLELARAWLELLGRWIARGYAQ